MTFLHRIALSHFMNALYSLMDSISIMMAESNCMASM